MKTFFEILQGIFFHAFLAIFCLLFIGYIVFELDLKASQNFEYSIPPEGTTPFEHSWYYYGVQEFASRDDEATIVSFLNDVLNVFRDSQTPWCSAFVNAMCSRTGYQGSGSLAARSFLEVGETLEKPETGCVVVLWRRSKQDWRGHVGFYIRSKGDQILIYGGNQNNAAMLQWYPKERVLGYRKLCPI